MKIIGHKLVDDNGNVLSFDKTGNFNSKVQQIYLIIHYTAGTSLKSPVNWFKNPNSKASAHVIIDRNGDFVQMVSFNNGAWHAGKSKWGELDGLNKYSLGIELVNAGKLKKEGNKWVTWYGEEIPVSEVTEATHKNENEPAGWQTYTRVQIEKALEIAVVLHNQYDFDDVLGHDDISPGRKVDPGPAFPINSFRSWVIGRV